MSDFRKWINLCETVQTSSRIKLSELKSFDELFGPNATDIEQEEDDILKSEKILLSHGWKRIPWKHPLGIFEWAFVNPDFRRYHIFLMDLKLWECEGPSGTLKEGKGWQELEEFLNDVFDSNG
jgi:hypothetical protein